MDLTSYRNKAAEKARSADLMKIIPNGCEGNVLDVGARDGWYSFLLADKFNKVIALDLQMPNIEHPKIQCVKGDASNLNFDDGAFELVFCTEVLEHIPPQNLIKVCSEIERVSSKYIVIGVPFKQDIRVARTKCYTCGKRNPPWGHVNSFDENKLFNLFPMCDVRKISFVGENKECTNALSAFLMDFSGNPYGTYHQEEPCIYCGAKMKKPPLEILCKNFQQKQPFLFKIFKNFFINHIQTGFICFSKNMNKKECAWQ